VHHVDGNHNVCAAPFRVCMFVVVERLSTVIHMPESGETREKVKEY
jgi:hypothetical protein